MAARWPFAISMGGDCVLWGFYRELEEMRADGIPDASFGFLENVPVGEAYNLYDFLHGWCDHFATALSDYFGYEIEYVVGNDNNLIHAYCVQALANGETAFIDARGITTDDEAFFDEFADFCTYYRGEVSDTMGDCDVHRCKNSGEMLGDKNRKLNQDKDLYLFLKDNRSYYDVNIFEREKGNMEKNNGLKEFEASLLARLEDKGIDVSKMEIAVKQFIDEKHQCCLWYGGQVAEVKYQGLVFSLEARGDIEGSLLDESNEVLCRVRDRSNRGAFYGEMRGFLADDAAVHAAELAGRLDFVNNNWFEIFVQMPDGEWSGKTWVCDHDDLKEAAIQMIEDMDYMIDEVAKDLDPEKDRELLGRLALDRFGYDVDLALEDTRCASHLDTFIAGYLRGTEEIDMDFWVQYEELLGEKMSYDEYIFVDKLYDGDPLELIDVELTEEEKSEFVELKDALAHYRDGQVNEGGLVGSLVEKYMEKWNPDTSDTIFEEIREECGAAAASAAVALLENEYKCWFDKADSVDTVLRNASTRSVCSQEQKDIDDKVLE